MKVSQTVTELWGVQEFLEKNNRNGITWKLNMEEQSALSVPNIHFNKIS